MKPLKLTVSAFGPYSNLQTIDFTQLNGNNIFLITGPTGAGKTTIFDAISYGLFGEASGTSRTKDSLRSDFASDNILTYVELEFDLRGKQYKIKRVPQQERNKLKGEGTVVKNSEAELYLPNGDLITKVNAVDEKITEILGINKNQFRQIVMLPQGEFRKLLEADSQERETIFRKIFGTEAFENIQRRLDDHRKSINKQISEKQTQRDTYIKNIESDSDALAQLLSSKDLNVFEILNRTLQLIEEDTTKSEEIAAKVKEIEHEQNHLQKMIAIGNEINKKTKNKEDIENSIEEYIKRKDEYRKKEQKVVMARKALPLIELESTFMLRQNQYNNKKIDLEIAEKTVFDAEINLDKAIIQLKEEEEKESDRKKYSDTIVTLRNHEGKVREYELKSKEINEYKKKLEVRENSISDLRTNINNEKIKKDSIVESIKVAQRAEVDLEKSKTDMDSKLRDVQELLDLKKYTELYISKKNKYNIESNRFEQIDSEYKGCKDIYEAMETHFMRGQAGLLSKDLIEGVECPVCGSKEHPRKAQIIEGMPSETELKSIREELDKLASKREKKLRELMDINGDLKASKEELEERKKKISKLYSEIITLDKDAVVTFSGLKIDKINNDIFILKDQISTLQFKVNKKDNLEDALKKCEICITSQQKELEELEEIYKDEFSSIKVLEEVLIRIEKDIPLEIRSVDKLLLSIKEYEQLYDQSNSSLKNAQQNHINSLNICSTSKTNFELQKESLVEMQGELEVLREQFYKRILDSGFKDINEYESLKLKDDERIELEEDIAEYNQSLRSLKDRLENSIVETQDLKEVDIEKLKEEFNSFNNIRHLLDIESKKLFSRISNNTKAINEIEKINMDIGKDEEKYGIIADLSKTANGDNNERITFERYVLAAYFEEIINASNIRLSKMTGGRYRLRRKEEKGKGRRQEGLELEGFDNYTGKARHVKTLSGGESFKASLALALGLADIVQSCAGGITLDTMFIDEGFGTLDPESLDNAINCLLELQEGGRLVGIISHVPELKERIDLRLEITPAKEGSRATFIL
ncbi:AAA family ATPase [Serpentinicella alkaliphila]|uniref:Nuclease SbcCD subunit C n=1 Tax=Serpentinicella alkaliphila TaxID=1734049 RepID=A0A4R2TIY7_9FIRM|nr:AAA family ATPase [Serpentinicella alkaliphila]QUH24803.1 AAA family ATPase [Serpentinicella alkaliphila]TCQ03498.1 exonuclease SbcC [Serpentinicella alkaliphila]